tara:strand:+ start:309 stop:500 length:192 start_codon:yes stop_codon:yes gene_type:complete
MEITWAAAAIDMAWAFSAVGISASAAYAVRSIAETVATYFIAQCEEVASAVTDQSTTTETDEN